MAAANSIESRHPFLDRRLVEFCMRLPDTQKIRQGGSKHILRRAMAGYLPDRVRWRQGKEHLGADLEYAFARQDYANIRRALLHPPAGFARYVRPDAVRDGIAAYERSGDPEALWRLRDAAHLAHWLDGQLRQAG